MTMSREFIHVGRLVNSSSNVRDSLLCASRGPRPHDQRQRAVRLRMKTVMKISMDRAPFPYKSYCFLPYFFWLFINFIFSNFFMVLISLLNSLNDSYGQLSTDWVSLPKRCYRFRPFSLLHSALRLAKINYVIWYTYTTGKLIFARSPQNHNSSG